MIKIYIFADSFKHFEGAIAEYEKRLGKKFKIIKLRPSKNTNSDLVIKEETSEIIKKLDSEKWYKIALNPDGEIYNTGELVDIIKIGKMNFSNIVFIIWWAYWFDYKKLDWKINLMLWLWAITMPHALALLVLVEQIYRVGMIEKGSSYHK